MIDAFERVHVQALSMHSIRAVVQVLIILPDKAQMHPQASMHTGAGQADEYAIWDSGPGGVFGRTVEADLQAKPQ